MHSVGGKVEVPRFDSVSGAELCQPLFFQKLH